MAKNKMNIKYKARKRERNKVVEVTPVDQAKKTIFVFIGLLAFLGLCYLCALGMQKLGLFDKGYEAPQKEDATVDPSFIAIGAVFNRNDKNYYVIFDNYESKYTQDIVVNNLLEKQTKKYYKVDMSANENKKFASNEENKGATKASELKINGVTLIEIKNGKIERYISGSGRIEEFLSNVSVSKK